MVNIPVGYWQNNAGHLEAEVPWLVPAAVMWLDTRLQKDWRVLEFGSGGSTMFFARRCAHVTSYEVKPAWMKRVGLSISKAGLTNVTQRQEKGPTVYWPELQQDHLPYDVLLLDTYVREPILALALQLASRMVIIDNYAAFGCGNSDALFPLWEDTHPNGEAGPPAWHREVFDDPHWKGKGTKVYWR